MSIAENRDGKKREKRPAQAVEDDCVYKGEWDGEMRDGYGAQTWPDEGRYEGNSRKEKFEIRN